MNNVNDVRTELDRVVKMVRRSQKNLRSAKIIAGACGKMLSSCALQVSYARARGTKPDIQFLNKSK